MSITRIVATLFLAAALAPAATYADTTINFSSLSQPGSTYVSVGNQTQAGFTISSPALYVWEASSPNLPGLSTSDTSLFEFFAGNTTTMTDGGNPFTLKSIDLAPLIAGGSSSFTVAFTGTLASSSTVTQTCTVNDSPDVLQTCDFSGFTNIVKLSFAQGTNSGFFAAQDTAYQFDNIDIAGPATGAPEPGSLALLAIGAAGLVGFSLKRKARAAA
jgi:PEP-CTERM motif